MRPQPASRNEERVRLAEIEELRRSVFRARRPPKPRDRRVARQGEDPREIPRTRLPRARLLRARPRPPEEGAGCRPREGLRADLRGPEREREDAGRAPEGGARGRGHLPRGGPGPRGGSDLLAPARGLETVGEGDAVPPRPLQRDH